MTVFYIDNNCNGKVGVPPESIYIKTKITSGTLRVNDQPGKIFADYATAGNATTRIQVVSFSGCGAVQCSLFVSGTFVGTQTATVRTADSDTAQMRVNSADASTPCDLNYDGSSNGNDVSYVLSHYDHWHRNALFGQLVQRTFFCETCGEGEAYTAGESRVFWSPSGRKLSYSMENAGNFCNLFTVPSDPAAGDSATRFTSRDSADYDPSWSPLGDVIVFSRDDWRLIRKGIPGVNPDTAEHVISVNGTGSGLGDTTPTISPDGQWVAFARRDLTYLGFNIWKIPIVGGTAIRLTDTHYTTDFYPEWSPDGRWILFDRAQGHSHIAMMVKSDSLNDSLQTFFEDSTSGRDTATPIYAPDGKMVTVGIGVHSPSVVNVRTHTLDPLLPSRVDRDTVIHYLETVVAVHGPDPILAPRLSPDGTRLALHGQKEYWAVRRNMSLPPQFTTIGSHSVADSSTYVTDAPTVSQNFSFQVAATDPESDVLSYDAYFLQQGMTFTPSTRTLSWTPPIGSVGKTYYVKFIATTPSGGMDAILDKITVQAGLRSGAQWASAPSTVGIVGPNPTHGAFVITMAPRDAASARLEIYDLSGRRLASMHAHADGRLIWDGRDSGGNEMVTGIYLYRLDLGMVRREGKIALVR